MIHIIKAEWHKLEPYRSFWFVLGIVLLGIPTLFSGLNNLVDQIPNASRIFQFPYVWHYVTYIASWFSLLLGVLVVIIVSNEAKFGTMQQNIIDGLSKGSFLLGKGFIVSGISLIVTFFVFLTGLISGFTMGQGGPFTQKLLLVPAYFVQTLGYLSFAMLVSFLFHKSGMAMMIFLLYVLIIENVVSWFIPTPLRQFLPMENMALIIPFPMNMNVNGVTQGQQAIQSTMEVSLGAHFYVGILYTLLFGFLSYLLLKYRDL